MFFSFFNRFLSKKISNVSPSVKSIEPINFQLLENHNGAVVYTDYKLFHHENVIPIDLLIFLPHHGILFGEKLSWTMEELKNATIEKASRVSKKTSTTHLESTESKIRQKLQDVSSFDSTPIKRFFWLESITEEDFETLHSSFHQWLPKGNLVFAQDSIPAILDKLTLLLDYKTEPYSHIKVIGSLNAHSLLLPTVESPFGSFLNQEEIDALNYKTSDQCISISGGYGSGKSTILIRKVIHLILNNPDKEILIITPSILSGELLRDQFISLMEYSALRINLLKLHFYPYNPNEEIEELKFFQDATDIFCDDAHKMDKDYINRLLELRKDRQVTLFTLKADEDHHTHHLVNRYREGIDRHLIQLRHNNDLIITLINLRKRLQKAHPDEIIIVLPKHLIALYRNGINEYFGMQCRILTPFFSLQYDNLESIILTTSDNLTGLSRPHLYLILPEADLDYSFALSRASESATIITSANRNSEIPNDKSH